MYNLLNAVLGDFVGLELGLKCRLYMGYSSPEPPSTGVQDQFHKDPRPKDIKNHAGYSRYSTWLQKPSILALGPSGTVCLEVLASKSGFIEFDENLYIGRILQECLLHGLGFGVRV